jgi:hypothetical protein
MIGIAVFAERRNRILWPAVIGIVWVLSGIIAYSPWPSEGMFYMMPFALGTMFIAAFALSRPLAKGSKHRRAAFGVATLLVLVASAEARSTLYQHRLRATLNSDVISTIAKNGGAKTLIGAVPTPLPGTGGWAHHVRGFGSISTGMRVDKWLDMSCADAKKTLESSPDVVVISMAGGCGPIDSTSVVLSESVPRVRWPWIWKAGTSEGRMYVAQHASVQRLSYSEKPR